MKKTYSVGIDYGTQSCRALLVDNTNGEEIACYEAKYPHGVMEEELADTGIKLGNDWALQHPFDYLQVLSEVTKGVLKETEISKDDIVGVGVDFTACTILPIDKNNDTLIIQDKYKDNPHAYVKLWKNHSAQKYADKFNEIAGKRNEEFLKYYGGTVSCEWLVPKVMQILEEDSELYNDADRFIEAGDWIVLKLTGEEKRSSCQAGYKSLWNKELGFPSNDFFKELDPRLENLVDDKLNRNIVSIGEKAGEINEEGAKLTGLNIGTAVAVANIDAHVAVPAAGMSEAGKMLMIMGTSTCHMVVSEEEKFIPGIGGIVKDGILPGLVGYEAGQACVGDCFGWFVKNCVPQSYYDKAEEMGMNIQQYLTMKAEQLEVGESGLVALDWWNGNRSVLVDYDLTGLIVGCTVTTKPEEIYRALIEATAYGTKVIIDSFEEGGVSIDELYAAGGIAQKNRMMMQIYADVTNRPIKICDSAQAVALGSAMFGAVAAGKENGGYDSIFEATQYMSSVSDDVITPNENDKKAYSVLFDEYKKLHDYFGAGGNNVMKKLKKIRHDIKANK